MDSRLAPIELKPIYWIPSGKTDWPRAGGRALVLACAWVFYWGVAKLLVLGWYVITHSFKPL
jgi:hypothetical protein